MDLIAVGINHQKTAVELRECLAYSEADARRFLDGFAGDASLPEVLLISTCNRTELYARTAAGKAESAEIFEKIRQRLISGRIENLSPEHFYRYTGLDAARQLFRVASGIDSMILGESQIIGQVRDAYRVATEQKTNGFLLNRVFHAAFRVGRRARTETGIGAGAVSVSTAAVELAKKIFHDITRKRVLIAGAGEMAALTAECFADLKPERLSIINRTAEKAGQLAAKIGGAAVAWDRLADAMAESDIIITATASPAFIITPDSVRSAMHRRRNKPISIIDISVPRNTDPAAGKIYNVFSHNIDDLRHIIDRNLAGRRAEIPKVERLIDDELKDFNNWYLSLSVTPTIRALLKQAEDIRSEEMKRTRGGFTAEQREQMEALTQLLVKKLLHAPITKLKEFAEDSDTSLERIDTVRQLFGLRTDDIG